MNKTENEIVLTDTLGGIPAFQRNGQTFCLLNAALDVEIDGVTYHLTSEFSEKSEMGSVIDTIELERSQRKTA